MRPRDRRLAHPGRDLARARRGGPATPGRREGAARLEASPTADRRGLRRLRPSRTSRAALRALPHLSRIDRRAGPCVPDWSRTGADKRLADRIGSPRALRLLRRATRVRPRDRRNLPRRDVQRARSRARRFGQSPRHGRRPAQRAGTRERVVGRHSRGGVDARAGPAHREFGAGRWVRLRAAGGNSRQGRRGPHNVRRGKLLRLREQRQHAAHMARHRAPQAATTSATARSPGRAI